MALFLGIILALLPGLTWLFFYLQEDPHPEPKLVITKVFVAGGATAFLALAVQLILQRFGFIFETDLMSPWNTLSVSFLFTIFLFAFVEEVAKFLGAYVSVHNDPAFDEPVDGMIYAIVASLGFATIENIGAVNGSFGPPGTALISGAVFETITFRFVGATLLHTLCSGLVGYYWTKSIRAFNSPRILLKGLLLASVLHAGFNYLIITYGNLIYAVVFVAMIGFFVLGDFEELRAESA